MAVEPVLQLIGTEKAGPFGQQVLAAAAVLNKYADTSRESEDCHLCTAIPPRTVQHTQ